MGDSELEDSQDAVLIQNDMRDEDKCSILSILIAGVGFSFFISLCHLSAVQVFNTTCILFMQPRVLFLQLTHHCYLDHMLSFACAVQSSLRSKMCQCLGLFLLYKVD